MVTNRTLIYKEFPRGLPVPGRDLIIEDHPLDLTAPPPGGLIVKILYSSLDPYLRFAMRSPEDGPSYYVIERNTPVTNDAIARVVTSDNVAFAEGDLVRVKAPIAEYAAIPADAPEVRGLPAVRKLENPYGLPLGIFLGALGMPGLTGYAALKLIGQPKAGETLFVNSAAGAVGQVVGQLGKRLGLRVIGSVGSDEKLAFITEELGFDSGFNYKKESPFAALPRLAPEGIDIYFENVGGEQLEAALENMNTFGRIPISQYNNKPGEEKGIRGLDTLIKKQLTMRGFLISNKDLGVPLYQEHQENLQQWVHEGSFKAKLHVTEGIENAAQGLVGMLVGNNFGKAVLKLE